MTFLHKSLLITVSLLSTCFTWEGEATWCSLWGKVAYFTPSCNPWTLKTEVSALREFTVCFSLQLENSESRWTAFMYHHPVQPYAELGFGKNRGRLVVWLFGTEFAAPATDLDRYVWYDLCITWSHERDAPTLYVNGNPVGLVADPWSSPSCCQLAPSGSLTLGASHKLVNGRPEILTVGRLRGKVSLFRIWSQEHSKEEVTLLKCTEGDVVKWEEGYWDTAMCKPIRDIRLQCEWSRYEVKLTFDIVQYGDEDNIESYTAKAVVHRWLVKVLPTSVYVPGVFVYEYTLGQRSDAEGTQKVDGRWAPFMKRFRGQVHLNIIPGLDVAVVQAEISRLLNSSFTDPDTGLWLKADGGSICTTAVDFFTGTPEPTTFTTPTTETTALTTTSLITTYTTSPPTASTPATTPASTSDKVTELTTFKTSTFTTTVTTSPANATDSFSTVVSPSVETTVTSSSTIATSPGSVSMLYFEVQVNNVSITGDCDLERTISTWLNSSLPGNTMTVLDLQLLPETHRSQHNRYVRALVDSVSRESCVFQVEVSMLDSEPQEIEKLIKSLLEAPYYNGSISIAAEDILISQIFFFTCAAEIRHVREGLFRWPYTFGGRNATLKCPKNPLHTATRHCKIRLHTYWLAPDLTSCPLVVEVIPDLDHVEVTVDNAEDVVDMIQDLLKNQSKLNYDDLATVLNKVEAIINKSVVTPPLGQALLDVISDLLESDSDLLPFTNIILNITEALGDRMTGYNDSTILAAPALAMSVVDVEPGHFRTLSFGVLSNRVGLKPEIFINKYPLNGTVAFISLPSVLKQNFPQNLENNTLPRIQFQFFGIPWLFKTKTQDGLILNTFVVSASVTNASSPIRDLDEEVRITLHHLTPNDNNKEVQCVYWNFNFNDGQGGWDPYGCRTHNSTPEYTTCLCDHLTHFGVLLDVSRTPLDPADEYILTIITYVGCGVSSLFLGITVLTYTAFEKLRRDYPSQILINLSLALLGLNLVFLVNSWLSSWGVYGLCIFVAAALHYFLLASFTWMGLEAVNMYFALVKVFNVYVPSYILKFCALGWGIPLVVCVVVLIVDREAYGSHFYTDSQLSVAPLDNSDNFCWIQDNVAFYISVVGYAALVFLLNTAVFIVVLIQIRRMRYNSPAGTHSGLMKDLKGVASLTLLLGLTWTIGFFTFGPARVAMLFLFSTLNSLQGLFIFVFHCLMKENVRKQWRIHLCFGRFRLEENSEWSNSASYGVMAKPKSHVPRAPFPSVRSVKSSSTESTSASSDSSQRESTSSRRPDLGLFVNALVIPRAQCSISGPALRSHGSLNPTPGWTNHLLTQENS